ncbi:MAG: pyridoxal phosphate-dependent aminotransferase family protein [Algicola sp.]|nr:pyridoxal phosphate-dependent aminotransferase family protein [Algicola sp.]
MLPQKLQHKLNQRAEEQSLRSLDASNPGIDFCSNDYLGFATSKELFDKTHEFLKERNINQNGATGSRLLSGNHPLYSQVEQQISAFHQADSALIFNSGYDANLGLFSCVPQRHDIVLYDEYCHASIRDGIIMSNAKSYKFQHNNLSHLKELIEKNDKEHTVFVVTESVFSMDGDTPDLKALASICNTFNAHLIIDEAHAFGLFGTSGEGLINQHHLENSVFARIITFGKALGCHGAAILGSHDLKKYLINFSRSLIYTTALPPHSLANIKIAYELLAKTSERNQLQRHISYFKKTVQTMQLQPLFIHSESAIQCCIIPSNEMVKKGESLLQDQGFNVKAIRSPTVPKGTERLRFCLHSFNTEEEISEVLLLLSTFVKTV